MQRFIEYVEAKTEKISELFKKLFEARQQAHLFHLSSKSHPEHVALGEFYDTLTDMTDKLVEVYQGQYDLVEISPGNDMADGPKELLGGLGEYLRSYESDDSHIKNIIDEITAVTYRTLYKLRFLK